MNQKINEIEKAASILKNGKLYTSSIHCFYYSCFLMMKYYLSKIDENPISLEIQAEKSKTECGSSHSYIFKELKKRFKNIQYKRKFDQIFQELKAERVRADYTSDQFTVDECCDVENNANRLKRILKDQFGL